MVVSTSSAGSSGGIFLSGKENEIILFLAVGDVFGAFQSLHRNLRTCLVLFCIGALGWCSSQLVCVHPLRTLAVAVQLLSDQRSPISRVFCPSFWSSVARVAVYTRCNFQSHHQEKLGNRPKCLWMYLNKRNGLCLEIKPGLLTVSCNCCPPNAELLQLFLTWGANALVVSGLGDGWTAVEVCSSEAAHLPTSCTVCCSFGWKNSAPLQPLTTESFAFSLLVTLKVVSDLLMQQHLACSLVSE